ncbi:MAG: hypothetical protein AB7V50_04200 [Vampirovibrionia bacterium]
MNLNEKREVLHIQLSENRDNLIKFLEMLLYSYNKCNKIGLNKEYDIEELESFEALTSRFARTADILTQKVYRTMLALLQEHPKTFIDMACFLEKLEIIESSESLLELRELRNQIAHEYKQADITRLFAEVMCYVPILDTCIQKVNQYIYSMKV